MDVVTADQMRRIEERAEALGISRLLMMENAGSAVAHFIVEKFFPLSNKHITIICGTGNNGGDGLVCLRHLAGLPSQMDAFLLGTREQVKTIEARTNLEIILRMASIKFYDVSAEDFSGRISDSIGKADVIVDAIFGTGVKGGIREPHASVIETINTSKAFKVAVDIPSGLDPNTGEVRAQAVEANATITFHKMKKGLLGNQSFTGELVVAPIGIPPDAESG
jgi:NAD(P)H-hydrate epimerase